MFFYPSLIIITTGGRRSITTGHREWPSASFTDTNRGSEKYGA
jgi:hypothetical protein